jgi:hypothetical protein
MRRRDGQEQLAEKDRFSAPMNDFTVFCLGKKIQAS